MRSLIFILTLFLIMPDSILCQPSVNNVQARKERNKIRITYDLKSDCPVNVNFYYSEDSGITWEESAISISGDIGRVEATGQKEIIWDVLKDREVFAGSEIVFKVTARLLVFKFIDSRDGTEYQAVNFGDYSWMQSNLNYAVMSGSWTYNDDQTNSVKYGRLYNWQTARSACPSGWHLPTDEEWRNLINYLGGMTEAGKRLKSAIGWGNTDNNSMSVNFDALPSGFRDALGIYRSEGANAGFWSSTSYNNENAIYINLYKDQDLVRMLSYLKTAGMSVRCIKRKEM